jgi:hypothetical protein
VLLNLSLHQFDCVALSGYKFESSNCFGSCFIVFVQAGLMVVFICTLNNYNCFCVAKLI